MSNREALNQQIEAWLAPLSGDDGPAGRDMEYENAFLELNKAAAGKPETQFDRGAPPEWRSVKSMAEDLFETTRDLRVAVLWLRATLALEGVGGLPAGLRLVSGLMTDLWDTVHPALEDGDPWARANAIAVLPQMEGVLGELLHARLVQIKGVADLRMRDCEVAIGTIAAREGETAHSREQIEKMLESADEGGAGVRADLLDLQAQLKRLAALMDERFGTGSGAELKPLLDVVFRALSLTHDAQADEQADEAGGEAAPQGSEGGEGGDAPRRGKGGGLSGGVTTRAEAIKAIDMVCDYLERTEPTNPAPLFLRRARSLLERNFLELLKELAPGALDEVARIVGVDPSTVGEPGE